MKQIITIALASIILAACTSNEERLKQRAEELCRYIPDHELLEMSKDYLTADFYAVLDTMFNHLPDEQPLDHEWLYYFVTGNGGTIADYTVTAVEQTDEEHAVATVMVRQRWEPLRPAGTSPCEGEEVIDSTTDVEEHKLYMENVEGRWLMSDFDGHKADCLRHIALYRQEQAVRFAIGDYLVNEVGQHYLQGELCVPTIMIVATEEDTAAGKMAAYQAQVWGDFWVEWYRQEGDTLKCVSGGNHSGLMSLEMTDGKYTVTSFEQTVDGAGWEPSARRIFGPHYGIYMNIHSNQDIREENRRMQLRNYLQRRGISARYYQDYGWPAVKIEN